MAEQIKDAEDTSIIDSHSGETAGEEAVGEKNHEETADKESTREFIGALKQNTTQYLGAIKQNATEYWDGLSARKRRNYIGATILTTLAIGVGIGSMGENESRQEQPEEDTPITNEVGTDSKFPGVSEEKEERSFDFGNNQINERAETGEESAERDVTKAEDSEEIITREIITEPNGTEITKEWYSPYSYTKTTRHPEDSEPQEIYQESSHEPLAPIDHPVYEHLTGTSYEDFLENVKSMTPELGGNPYDAEDVLKSWFERSAVASNQMDPRYIETINASGSEYYRMSHKAYKQAFEEGKNPIPAVEQQNVEFHIIARKETFSGVVFEDTNDLNVSMTQTFTVNYGIETTYLNRSDDSTEEVNYGNRQATLTRQNIPGIPETSNNEIFLMQNSQRLQDPSGS